MRSTHVDSSRSVSDRVRRGVKAAGGGRSSRRAALRRSCALEALEARLLLHGNTAEDAEHAAVFGTYVPDQATGQQVNIGGLLPDSSITDTSVKTGNWSDPKTWSNGVPASGANVLITGGTTVTVDGDESAASLHGIRVDGTLTFSTTANTKLLVDTIIVEPQGSWVEGTAANPIPAGVTAEVSFADDGDINTAWDPGQFSRGLLTHGAVSIYGSEVASFYPVAPTNADGSTTIPATPTAKGTPPPQITLNLASAPSLPPGVAGPVPTTSAPQGWKVGDRLIITGDTASNASGVNQDEQVSIAAINGSTITLSAPLKYAHTAPAGESIEVSDVTRNVVFDSQSIALGDNVVAHRGHIMFMHNGNVNVDAAGFYGLGRTDKRNPIDDPNPVEDVLAEQAEALAQLAGSPAPSLPADDYYALATNTNVNDLANYGKYLADANGNPINATATVTVTYNGASQQVTVNKIMTTDVLDAKTGQRVMVPVMDASGKPIPLYKDPGGNVVPWPSTSGAVPSGYTPLYQAASDGSTLKDASGNPVPQYETQVAKSGLNPRGRYSVHFHRTDQSQVATINDSAVVDSPGWGIVNHSSNVAVTNNVVFNALGAAYVTEAGDELGSFDHNIAIHSQGAGGGIEDRKNDNDFGQLGDGFWLQGGNVSLTNNIATGMRHSGFVFFPVGLAQKGLLVDPKTGVPGPTQIAFDTLDPKVQQALLDVSPTIAKAVAAEATGGPEVFVPDGEVPLRQFSGNTAFADGDGLETWFSLLDFSDAQLAAIAKDPKASLQSVVSNFHVWDVGGTGIFDPYTNSLSFQNVKVLGALNNTNAGTTAFNRNDVTRNLSFIDVNVQGWGIGINAPVNGAYNAILGGTFNNLKSIYINTANDPGRVVNIADNGSNDPIKFLDNLTTTTTTTTTTTVNGKTTKTTTTTVTNPQQYDIYLQSKFDPRLQDITTLFNPDVIRLGTVTFNGAQLYYNEQAANFVPFPSASAASYIPSALLDKTNQQLFDQYGLAIGGVLAPSTDPGGGGSTNPKINGIIGSVPASYLPTIQLVSAKYTQFNGANYTLIYRYYDPTNPNAAKTGSLKGYVTVTQKNVQLQEGWNLLTFPNPFAGQTGQPANRTLLVYGDNTAPTFTLKAGTPLVVNRADVDNGSTYYIQGTINDNSFGSKTFQTSVKLNDTNPKDPAHVQPVYLSDGTTVDPDHIMVVFTVTDNANNKYTVMLELTVSDTAVLLKDVGRKDLPTIAPSDTLIALVLILDPAATPNKKG